MAKNDRNNQQGKLGEIRVAEALLQSGCVVNFLNFMDVGLDLHVQLPAGSTPPRPDQSSWSMSGKTAHIQVKSTKRRELPPIATETARAWQLGALAGTPTLLVAVLVNAATGVTTFQFFDPLVVNEYAEATTSESFKIQVSRGEEIEPDDLFQRVSEWIDKSPYYLADGVGFTWVRRKRERWTSALSMVSNLTRIYERAFQEPEVSVELQPFAETAEALMKSFLDGARIDADVLYSTRPNFDIRLIDEVLMCAHDVVNEGVSAKHGWSTWIEPLSSVSPTLDQQDSLSFLKQICFDHGAAVQGRLKLPLYGNGATS